MPISLSISHSFPTAQLGALEKERRSRHVFGTSCFLPLKSLQVIHQRDEITWQMSWQGCFCRTSPGCRRRRAVMRNALGPLRPGTKVSTTICTSHKTPENIQMQICQEKKIMQLSFKAFKTGLKVTMKICNILFKSLIFILLGMLTSMKAVLEFFSCNSIDFSFQ